jgi:hypothetical protein
MSWSTDKPQCDSEPIKSLPTIVTRDKLVPIKLMLQQDPIALPPANTPEPPEASTNEEPIPMLDVHPAHHAANSWRDFFIHIATIVLGLCIAVGLEQTVELLHQRHQLHQLQQDLREEGLNNQAGRDALLRYLDLTESIALDRLSAVNARREGHLKQMPAMPPGYAASLAKLPGNPQMLPSKAAWATAEQSQLLELLPREDADVYNQLYRQLDLVLQYAVERNGFADRTSAIRLKFSSRETPGVLDAARMNEAQMDDYATRLAEVAQSIGTLRSFYARFSGQNDAILNGVRSLPEIVRAGEAAVAALPKNFGVLPGEPLKPAPK